jgi:pSer/pThr/pTyr-binding forkhead associated (FHA) protein
MFDWISSGAFQISILVLIVVAVVGGIGVTALRQRVSASVPQAAAAATRAPLRSAAPSPEATSQPETLALLEFEDDPRVVSIARPRVVIGRHSDDDIRIRDVTVSRHHALLELDANGNFTIHNQTANREEPNQLLVNGIYREHATLNDGDLVTLGGVTFRFRHQLRQVA